MKTWLDISTPSAIYTQVSWPEAPFPAKGDKVLFRRGDVTWGFQVIDRMVAIGVDPHTGVDACQISLRVDTEPPTGFVV